MTGFPLSGALLLLLLLQGFIGLAITIGSILTLFVAVQLTGRVRRSELFAAEPARGRLSG